ncbi:cyclodeaminase/cyclohydrolase family protein [Thermoanaerobacterium sp. DL9XJH110]|uniref:cyclodeaminase/cyclohydrolase family protein n=1 Tax=Thermoanaerobacterium sp. DL9XJH110 TaxID=3386643 RepID=UPI003BB6DD0A
MQLSEYAIEDFLSLLASGEPAPGGGAASALVGAVGTALCSMVANLTSGKEKFKEKESFLREILQESCKLQESLTSLIDKDTEAFNGVSKVFKMPRETDEQKEERKKAMERALKNAALVPLSVMEDAVAALRLHEKAVGNTAAAAVSDIGVGALCLKAALQGAWLNIKINLNGIKDRAFVEEFDEKSGELLKEGSALADKIFERVLKIMGAS